MNGIKTVAVVGLGIGRSHLLEGYAKHQDKFRVLALCDLDEVRLAKVADEFGVERRTTSFDAVLSMQDVDVVDVCTPPMIHKPQVLAALGAGKHVICEKPLVGSLADIDAVIAAEKTARGRVMPIFQYRWGTGFRKALRLLHDGFAGKPFVATAETHWKRAEDYYSVPWRGRYDTELGGVLLTQAIHLHDMMCELMGPISSLSAYTTTRVNPIEVEDCASAALRFASGALGTLSATLGGANEISRLRLTFEHVTMESGLEPYAPGNDPWTFIARDPSRQGELDAIVAAVSPAKPRFEGQMEDYHAALVAGAPLPVTLADARRSLELITALYDAAERESVVRLPLPSDHPKAGSWRPTR
jgi:predicted dehydrogenase